MPNLIELTDVSKEYQVGETVVRALRGVDLSIRRGEFVAIMGPSGCGKSTLMYTLGFLDRPTGGRYVFDGREAENLDEDERARIRNAEIGYVFQSYNLLPRTSVLDNVLLPVQYRPGANIAKARARALELIDLVGISHRAHARPNQLSGGEQQRAAIARALINEPSLILADEPTGNLDSTNTAEVMDLIDRLHRDGNTIVMVTHEDDIGGRAERIVRMRDGRVESAG
jgi:putative ABC transport system ATP-binding protein